MDRRIEDSLEKYLSGSLDVREKPEFEAALAEADEETRATVARFERHSHWIRSLRPAEPAEPAPGFYARVMERIEAQKPVSIWAALVEPVFFRRLAFASMALFCLMAVALFTGPGPQDEVALAQAETPVEVLALPEASDFLAGVSGPEQSRDVILGTLATYSEGSSAAAMPAGLTVTQE